MEADDDAQNAGPSTAECEGPGDECEDATEHLFRDNDGEWVSGGSGGGNWVDVFESPTDLLEKFVVLGTGTTGTATADGEVVSFTGGLCSFRVTAVETSDRTGTKRYEIDPARPFFVVGIYGTGRVRVLDATVRPFLDFETNHSSSTSATDSLPRSAADAEGKQREHVRANRTSDLACSAEAEHVTPRVVDLSESGQRQTTQRCAEKALLEDEQSAGADRRRSTESSRLPVRHDDVTESGCLAAAGLAGDHRDDHVRSALVGVGRDDARGSALHPAEVRVRERDENDVAASGRQLRGGRLGHVVVDRVLFREPVRRERCTGGPRGPSPSE